MVTNPIYEGGALYEEIPACAPPLPPDRDNSYVTITSNPANEVKLGKIKRWVWCDLTEPISGSNLARCCKTIHYSRNNPYKLEKKKFS